MTYQTYHQLDIFELPLATDEEGHKVLIRVHLGSPFSHLNGRRQPTSKHQLLDNYELPRGTDKEGHEVH